MATGGIVDDSRTAADRSAGADRYAFESTVIIQLARIYDVLITQLAIVDPDRAAKLLAMHAEGDLFCPTPAIRIQNDDTDTA